MTLPIEPATYGKAMKAAAQWDADNTITRIGAYHARHQARAHAERVVGAWSGLSADGFGVWVRTAAPVTILSTPAPA